MKGCIEIMKFDFKDKNVIVTGAGKGLGKSIALEFAKAGANVVVADLSREDAINTAREISNLGVKTVAYTMDVSKYDQFEALTNYVVNNLGSVDILINNAGICVLDSIINMDVKTLDKIISIDLNGTLYGCKAVLPEMKKQGYGKIVNMSSIAAKLSGANCSVYSCVKAAVISLTAALAREYAKDNININCILPGIIRTPLWEGMLDTMTNNDESKKDSTFASFTDQIPTGRPQEPIDIAHMALFLCSEEALNVTGQNIGVDGGQTF